MTIRKRNAPVDVVNLLTLDEFGSPKLTVELVPSTAWGDNLRSILTKDMWDTLRKRAYKKARYRCEVCFGKGPKWPVECHERWKYDDTNKIQTMTGLIALCPDCHSVKHLGFAHIQGKGERAREHLASVNQWSQSTASQYIGMVFEQWEERSKHDWDLNLDWLGSQSR